jgi:thioredoxin 1
VLFLQQWLYLAWVVVVIMVVKFLEKNKKMSNFNDIINSEKPVLVDFFATWCGPCQMLLPVLNQVKDNLQDRITIIKIDVDKNQELAQKQQVRGVPTMMLFQNGKQLWRQSGVLTKEEIINIILDKINS